MKPLTLIVAMTPAGVIAVDGKIPWHVFEDMKRFKRLTTGHAIIMGRKTFESIGRPLPNRRNIVLSRKPVASLEVEWQTSFEDALKSARNTDESPFVIGGGEIYTLAFPHVTKLEITYVARKSEQVLLGERGPLRESVVFFPGLYPNPWHWRCVRSEPAIDFPNVEFMTFERRPSEEGNNDGPGV